jgi:hypothetical protein
VMSCLWCRGSSACENVGKGKKQAGRASRNLGPKVGALFNGGSGTCGMPNAYLSPAARLLERNAARCNDGTKDRKQIEELKSIVKK